MSKFAEAKPSLYDIQKAAKCKATRDVMCVCVCVCAHAHTHILDILHPSQYEKIAIVWVAAILLWRSKVMYLTALNFYPERDVYACYIL